MDTRSLTERLRDPEWVKHWFDQAGFDAALRIEALESALGELHAMVWGECPSLLDEDSGGTARLDLEIKDLLNSK